MKSIKVSVLILVVVDNGLVHAVAPIGRYAID